MRQHRDGRPRAGADASEKAGVDYLARQVMAYREAKILLVANDLDLFTRLAKGATDPRTLARAIGADERALATLMHALVAMGLLRKRGARFHNTPLAARCLVAGRPGYRGDNLKYQELIWECWSHLGEVVRTGMPPRDLGALLATRSTEFVRRYIHGMDEIARGPSQIIARRLGLARARHMLDVGGGPGTYTRAFVRRHPRLNAVILDLPGTLEVTAELIAGTSESRRIRLQPGDYTRATFGRGLDLVFLSHVTHDESERTNRRLFAKAAHALRPGGRIAVHDFTVSEQRTAPRFGALFAVNMLVYTRGGSVYSKGDYRRWLSEAGFRAVRSFDVLKGKAANWTTVITGIK